MDEDILHNINENVDINGHENCDSQDEHDEEILSSTEIASDKEENMLEISNITTNDNDIKEFSSVLFSKSLKDMDKKFQVISIEFYGSNVNVSSRFSKIEKFKNIKKYKVQCIGCSSKITCFPSSVFNMTRHSKSCSVKTSTHQSTKVEKKKVKKNSLRERVKNFLLSTAVPFTTITNPSFSALLQENPNRIPAINTVKNDIKLEYQETMHAIKEYFSRADFVCLTADCWTTFDRTFIGMTCLLFDYDGDDKYSKKRFMLACKRITESITFDVIAQNISSVINEFDLKDKVVCVITDGGSNFVKAFRIYNANELTQSITTITNDQETVDSETVHSISEIETNLDIEQSYSLPPRIPCFSHILNLIGSKDILKSKDDQSEFEIVYEKVMSQFKALWNINGRSTKFSNKFKSKLGISLKTPAVTRWNYLFDSITFLNDMIKDGKMNLIQSVISEFNSEKSGSRFSFSLSDRDLLFVEEFLSVMKPLAHSLDYLQADSVCIGEVLPAIALNIEFKLKSMDKLNICEPLKERILDALDKRLGMIRHDIKILASTVIHPMFKRFRTQQMLEMSNDEFEHIHKYLLNEMKVLTRNESESSQPSLNDSSPLLKSSLRLNRFFSFENNEESILEEYSLEDEMNLLAFYNDKDFSFSIFDNPSYFKIKKVFLKLNTAVTSSGSVERLFSEARNVLTLSRSNLKDDIFEKMLFLRVNKNYSQTGSEII